MRQLGWHTEKRKVSDLQLFEGNPRQMTEKQAKDLLKSLQKFNLVEIPAIDQNNRVIAGNMRVQALQTMGKGNDEIDVRVANRGLTEDEAREYLIRSNKNVGVWDFDLLANWDEKLLLDVGFSQDELDSLFEIALNKEEEIEIKAYDKIHFLISIPKDKIIEANLLIEDIKRIEGIEIETTQN